MTPCTHHQSSLPEQQHYKDDISYYYYGRLTIIIIKLKKTSKFKKDMLEANWHFKTAQIT